MLQYKIIETDKFSYSLFCFTLPQHLHVKMTFNADSFSDGTWNVSPALSGVLLYSKSSLYIMLHFLEVRY